MSVVTQLLWVFSGRWRVGGGGGVCKSQVKNGEACEFSEGREETPEF